jgi:hypothetical protein
LAKKRTNLIFNGWKFAPTVEEAEYLDKQNLFMPAIGFLLQAVGDVLDFRRPSMALQVGARDFFLTSPSGRVGQGLARAANLKSSPQ